MSKLFGLAFAGMLLLVSADPVRERFTKYKVIEAYEIRPGILMMPSYSPDGLVCEIGLQRRHYSPEKIRLDSGLSRKEIDQILEELVPADERGPTSKGLGSTLITQAGHGIVTNIEFENISIQIVSAKLSASRQGDIVEADIVATVHWKNRQCPLH